MLSFNFDKMDEKILNFINEKLPTRITEIKWIEPLLFIRTDCFIFNARTEWRIFDSSDKYVGCYDKQIDSEVLKLVGEEVLVIKGQNSRLVDPLFELSNGYEIGIFSSSNSEEVWSLRLVGENIFIEANENNKR